MSAKREDYVKETVNNILSPTEEILCISKARNSESMYVTLVNDQRQYLPFRVSNHATYSGFLSVPTFTASSDLADLVQDYVDKSSWISLSYEDYFMIKVIARSRKFGTSIQIDDLYSVFTDEKQGMIFYQVKVKHRKVNRNKISQTNVNAMDEPTNDVLRKLYATNLISSRQTSDGNLVVYVSEAGFNVMHRFDEDYKTRFEEDYLDFNWFDVSLPNGVHGAKN